MATDAMPETFGAYLPLVPPSKLLPNASRRLHYHERARISRDLRQDATLVLTDMRNRLGWEAPFAGPVAVHYSILWPWRKRRRMPDLDGVALALKPVTDALMDAGIIVDDGQIVILTLTQAAEIGEPGSVYVTVERTTQGGPTPAALAEMLAGGTIAG